MTIEADIKREVRTFYDSIGWSEVGPGVYQNARYEDLRPVSRAYIHKCHLRVGRHLPAAGRLLLDAGSGPIQYPEYLEYSRGYGRRVCLDISIVALREARQRIGERGLFVVGDLAYLPFASDTFEGVVSLHTLHHLPESEHEQGVAELSRVLAPGGGAAVVYSWGDGGWLMRLMAPFIRGMSRVVRRYHRRRRMAPQDLQGPERTGAPAVPKKTHTHKHGYRWARRRLGYLPGFEVRVWRSVNTAFMRAFIHERALGRLMLSLLYRCEEAAPHLMGRIGQYPMLIFSKPGEGVPELR